MTRLFQSALLGATCSFALHAQEAKPLTPHKIPVIVDAGGGFHLCKVNVDGKEDEVVEKRQVIPLQGPDAADAAIEGIFKQHYQEIPLTRSKDGHYFVKVAINGKDRWMCLDSGADGILLDRKIAEEDGIELTEAGTATGADGKSKPSFRGTVETLRVGESYVPPSDIPTEAKAPSP